MPLIPDKKKAVTVILSKSLPGSIDHEMSEKMDEHPIGGEHMEVLHGIAEDLMHAIKIGSAHAVALALKAAFEALEMEPHVEGPHMEEEEEELE